MVKQVEELTYRETWENHDATRLEMARHIDGPSLFLLSAASKGVLSVMKCLDAENRRALALTSLERMVANNDNSQVGRVAVNSLDLTILGYRNDIALNAYDELQVAEPGREAVLLWGQGHLIGLDEGFSQRGFVKTDVQQLLAIDLDNAVIHPRWMGVVQIVRNAAQGLLRTAMDDNFHGAGYTIIQRRPAESLVGDNWLVSAAPMPYAVAFQQVAR